MAGDDARRRPPGRARLRRRPAADRAASRRSGSSASAPTSRRSSSPAPASSPARVPGAVFGFCVGIFVDLAFAQTLGVSALLLPARRLRRRPRARAARAGGAGVPAGARRGGDRVRRLRLCGASSSCWASTRRSACCSSRDILVAVVLNSLIAVPVHAVVRRWLVPALPEDPRRRRRRRAYTTGGLSPLSRP